MTLQIIIVIAVFAVLIVLVAKGTIAPRKKVACNDVSVVAGDDETQTAKLSPIEKTYLASANSFAQVTFEVSYRDGSVGREVVGAHSDRYEQLKSKEPKRLHLSGGWGNDIDIVYEDGHAVTCECMWASWEASKLREQLLLQDARTPKA